MESNTQRRPYAAAANVIGVIGRARSRNLPEYVDNDFLRIAGVPEAAYGRVMQALQFLQLVEPDLSPSNKLRAMAAAPELEYKEQLAAAIKEAYRDDFRNIDPGEDDQSRIIDAFRRYEPRSQTPRMVMFFLGMCREAGLPVKDAPRERQMQRNTRTTQGRRTSQPRSRNAVPLNEVSSMPSPAQVQQQSPGLLFGISESDVAALDETDFNEVWAALGKVARARARRSIDVQTSAAISLPSDEDEVEETEEA